MAGKKFLIPFLFLIFTSHVKCETFIEKSYEYVMNFGKSIAPNLMSIWECMGEEEAWSCAKEKAGKMLDGWNERVENERRSWQVAADAEVASSGRSFEEMPSKIGQEVESALASLTEVVHNGIARALQSRKHSSGGIDSITISTGDKKTKKKKQKPPKIHLIHPVMIRKAQKMEKGRSFPNGRQTWVIGGPMEAAERDVDVETGVGNDNRGDEERDDSENWRSFQGMRAERGVMNDNVEGISEGVERGENDWRGFEGMRAERGIGVDDMGEAKDLERGVGGEARGVMADLWSIGGEALDVLADTALEAENKDNGVQDKSSFEEQRGKKKKKKKAILKLLILGAVLKAKIGTLLQILSFKLQVKFFIVAVLGLAINLARLWIDLKNKHKDQPQKVIYYEHAQHQHHYDHEDEHESPGWGPWSRSMEPEETDVEIDVDLQNQNSPYRGQERNPRPPFLRPINT